MKRLLFALVLIVTLIWQPSPVQAEGEANAGSATDLQPAGVVVISAPSGIVSTLTTPGWFEIPKMKAYVNMPQAGDLAVTFCASTFVQATLWVRVTDNGFTLAPGSVVFAVSMVTNSHCFTFVENNTQAGYHIIRAEWMVSAAYTAGMLDRTMTITFANNSADEMRLLSVAVQSGFINAPYAWTDVPGLTGNISLPYDSDLAITFSAEAYPDSSGVRLYARALVDDQLAFTGQAVFAAIAYFGAHAFTFVQKNVPAGNHTIRLQYSCDGDYQCNVGNRSMFVVATSHGLARQVVSSFNPQQGGWLTSSSTSWADMPYTDSTFYSPSEADLAIQFSASIFNDNNSTIWLRALMDGQPTEPGSVAFVSGSRLGGMAFMFVVHNLPRGNHSLQMQWRVDSGTANLGDHTTAAWGFASQHPILMTATESVRGLDGYQYGGLFANSVVDLLNGQRTFKPYVSERLFGAYPSVAGYFLENSYGNYYLVNGGVRGPYLKQYNEYYYRNNIPDPFTAMILEAEQKADEDGFDFSLFDRNGDGIISPKELVTFVVFYQDWPDGFVRSAPNYVTNDGVTLDNSNLPYAYLPDFQTAEEIGVIAHELAHVLINAGDMYVNFWKPSAPGPYSLMDQHFNHPHLDPWHKLHAGSWFDAMTVSFDGYVVIKPVENYPFIYKLADPSHPGEYFLIENRQKIGYDSALPDTGLAIWHINENTGDVFRDGVMIEPACGPTNPIQWDKYLWDGSGTPWGKDFWWGSTGSNSRYVDGSDSKMGVWAIPSSDNTMIVYLDTPGPGVLLQALPGVLNATPGESAYIWMRLVNTSSFPDTYQLTTDLPAAWVQWQQNSITLTSYQQQVLYLKITPPKGTPGGKIFFNVTANGTTSPYYVSTSAPTNVLNITLPAFLPMIKK